MKDSYLYGRYLGFSGVQLDKAQATDGLAVAATGQVNGVLNDPTDWWERIPSGSGYFDRGSAWRDEIEDSRTLRIATLILCSGKMANTLDNGTTDSRSILDLNALLSEADPTDVDRFKTIIFPRIEDAPTPHTLSWISGKDELEIAA